MQAGLVGWEMVCSRTYPPHPGRLSRRYPIAYFASGDTLSCTPRVPISLVTLPRLRFTWASKHPVRVRSRAEARGATCGPRGQGTCSLPRGRDTTLSIRTTNESPGNLRGWRRGCERIQGHTREHKAHVRAHLTRQAGSGRAWADWGHAIDPLNIPRFTLTPEQLTSLWLVTRPAQATPRQCNPWAFVSCRAAAVVCHGSAPVRLRAVTHLVPFGRHVLVFCNPTFYWR